MNQGNEASSSSPSHPDNSKAAVETAEFLLNESKQLRGEVHCGKSIQTLIFYSRVINTAFEAIKTMVDRFNAMDPSSETEHIANCCKEACDVNKEVISMLSNVIQTSSSTSNTGGGYKKVLMWKKQCDKNIDKIELLIKDAYSREFYTWFDAFVFHGMFHGFSGVLACLYNILTFKDTSDDQNLKSFSVGILEIFEKTYRKIICEEKDKIIEGMKHQKSSQKEEEEEEKALEKLLEQTTATQQNMQEEEMGQKIIQEEKVQKNSQEAEINKKLQEAETHEKSLEDEALKKIQEEEALKKLEEEEALNELHLEEETHKKLQKVEEMKNLPEEEALKNLQEKDTQKKLQEEEEEEEVLKKIQEEETQKNSPETGVNKKLQEEEEALKKSQVEENTGDEIFKFGNLTFKMKNGVMEQVLE